MAIVDDLLQELRGLRREMSASEDTDAALAAQRLATEAKAHDAAAAASRLAAKKARDDDDTEDAKKHDAAAQTARQEAARCRMEAAKSFAAAAAARRSAEDEDGAKAFEAAATQLQADETTEAARHRADEEAAKEQDALAASKRGGRTDNIMGMIAALLTASDADGLDGTKDDENLALLKAVMAMVYPNGMSKKRSASAAHDDEAEDRQLFRKMMKEQHASSRDDLRLRRLERQMDMQGARTDALLTDIVHTLRDLVTDHPTGSQGTLATDTNRGKEGGPVRRTLAATGTDRFVGQFDNAGEQDQRQGAKRQFTIDEVDAGLDKEGLTDPIKRMARKMELQAAGQLK